MPADTVSVELLYTRGSHAADAPRLDPESDLFELTRDLGCWGADTFDRREISPAEAIASAYVSLGAPVDVDASDYDGDDRLLGDVYVRTQGGRCDDVLPYSGDRHRSLSVGDVVVLDESRYYMVAAYGFDRLDVEG